MPQQVGDSQVRATDTPYPPSWIDRLILWIDSLPGPDWAFYLLSALFVTVLTNALFWIDGSIPVGSFVPIFTSFTVFVFSPLALYHYLTRVGSRSLQSFRPLLEVDNLEFSRIDYELSALPRRLGLLTIPIGFALAAASVLGDPTSLEDFVPRTALPYLAAITLAGFVTTTFFCLLLRSARQLQMVSRLHARATNISLLKLHPTQALSALTAQTAIAVILFLVIGYLLDPSSFGTAWDIASYFAVVLLAIAIFALPLMGMRNHLEVEKLRMLDHISDLLKIASDRLHSNVTSEHYADMKETEAAINALLSERDLISKISTFPWHPTAVRGLASAIVLPLFLWLVTRLLENVI